MFLEKRIVEAKNSGWHASLNLKPKHRYVITPGEDSYSINGGVTTTNYHGSDWMDGTSIHIPDNQIRLGGLIVLVWHHQSNGKPAHPEIIDFPPDKTFAEVTIGNYGGSMHFLISDLQPGYYADNSGHCQVQIEGTEINNLYAFSARDGMEFSVKVSRNGFVETERYAGLKRQSGTYHHYFWFGIIDSNDDTVYKLPNRLKLTIGAATDPRGRPSFVSKREFHDFKIPVEAANALDRIVIYMERNRGGGSLIDQIEEVNRVYKRLKDMEIVEDSIEVVKAIAASQ